MLIKDNLVKNHLSARKEQRIPFLDEPDLQTGVTRLWLVRHALVAPLSRQTMYGNQDVPLCLKTLKDQSAIYQILANRLPHSALWVSSPVTRAVTTALTLIETGHLEVTLQKDPRFMEQDLGLWSGLPYDEFCQRRTQKASDFWAISANECPPEGESLEDVKGRVGTALEDMVKKNAGQETVIISHGGVIRMALSHAMAISAEAALRFTIQNLSVTILEHIADQWRVITVNSLSHFREKAA